MRKKWLQFVGLEEEAVAGFRLCIHHFDESCIKNRHPRPLLYKNAVPTLQAANVTDNKKQQARKRRQCDKEDELSSTLQRGIELQNDERLVIRGTNESVQDGVEDGLNTESKVTKIKDPILFIKNKKQLSATELPDPNHLKLSTNANGNSVNLIGENSSQSSVGNGQSKEGDNTSETVQCISETLSTSKFKRVPEKLDTPLRRQLLKHDHHYHATPESLKRQYEVVQKKLKIFKKKSKVQQQHIRRLKKKISTLNELLHQFAADQQCLGDT